MYNLLYYIILPTSYWYWKIISVGSTNLAPGALYDINGPITVKKKKKKIRFIEEDYQIFEGLLKPWKWP